MLLSADRIVISCVKIISKRKVQPIGCTFRRKNVANRNSFAVGPAFLFFKNLSSFPEEQGNTPECRQADQNIDDSADYRCLTTADPCDDIEFKKSDASPVYSTDNRKNKANSVHHSKYSFFVLPKLCPQSKKIIHDG